MDRTQNEAPDPSYPDAEINAHAETYHRFMLGVKWMAIHLAVLLVFLLLWFCTSAGFFPALVAAVIVLAAGVYAMAHGLAHSTERDNPHALQPRHG